MFKIAKITAFFLSFVMCLCVKNASAEVTYSSYEACAKICLGSCVGTDSFNTSFRCVNADLSTKVELDNNLVYRGDDDNTFNKLEFCTQGSVQYKGDGSCGTLERKCCGVSGWSGYGEDCPETVSCGSNQCWNGTVCEDKPTLPCTCLNGTCSYSFNCSYGSGWTRTGGTCNCNEGFTMAATGSCTPELACKITSCPSGEHLVNAGTKDCCCEFDSCGQTYGDNRTGCKCPVTSIGREDNLPYGWVDAGSNCWSKFDCGYELGECNEYNAGQYGSKWDSTQDGSGCGGQHVHNNGNGICRQYLCRQG